MMLFHDHGVIVVFEPTSDEDREWLMDNIGEPNWGTEYACEGRMAMPILEAYFSRNAGKEDA